MYGSNHTWAQQYPIDTQPQPPINHDFSYGTQPDTTVPQDAYSTPYQAQQYLPQSASTDFQSGGASPQSIPHQRQYSNSTTSTLSPALIDQAYYPPTFDSSSSYLPSPFDPTGNPNASIFSSPTQPDSILSDIIVPDGVIPISSPSQALVFGPSVTQQAAQQYYPLPPVSTASTKRHHPDQPNGRNHDEEEKEQKESAKSKLAACTRCKSLKVKCEMKTETDPCKRCLNTGHPCLTPNKKQRRTPPKREHLMSQIREQAAHIQELMGHIRELMVQLESRNDGSASADRNRGSDADFSSPLLSSTSLEFSDTQSHSNSATSPEVLEWINKAKESMKAFGEFATMDSAAIAKTLGDEDPDEESSEDDLVDEEEDAVIVEKDDDSHVAISVVSSDDVVETARDNWKKIEVSDTNQNSSNAGPNALTPLMKKLSVKTSPAIPAKTSPWGLMFDMVSRKKNTSRKGSEASSDGADVGVANEDFFMPGDTPDVKDNLLSQNIVTPQEVEKLFNIYFDYMNISLSLLDPALYTAKQTYYRSSFLFTVICAIASRYYTERPELYPQLMDYAKQAAGKVLVHGKKSVEVCHGYILLSLYPVATRRWEEDRSWIYLGLAIRLATDLNLHHPVKTKPQNEYHAREVLNRERLWINCFNLDRSMGSQYGKAPIIKNTDYIACHSEDWWKSSPYNMSNFDIHICAYNADLRVMSAFNAQIYNDPNHPTGLNKDVDFEKLASDTDDELKKLSEQWFSLLATTDMSNQQNQFRTALLRLAYSYARLIALSFGFQHHFSKNHTVENPFLQRCIRAASDVVITVVDDIAGIPDQKVYLRHGPEAHCVFVTFAASFLVKLLQPKFASYLSTDQWEEMRSLVQKTINHLGSPEIAVDNRHGPKLYARFLEGLLGSTTAKSDGVKRQESFSKKAPLIPKSSTSLSPEPERHLEVPATTSPPPSVPQVVRYSPSPKPSRASLSFDLFAPILAGSDPFAPASARIRNAAGAVEQNPTGMVTHTDFFQQPSFDDNFMQSMQVLPSDDAMMWDTINQTGGIDWMNELRNFGSAFSSISQYASV